MGFSSWSGQILVEFAISAAAFLILFYTLIQITEYRIKTDQKNRFTRDRLNSIQREK